MIKVLIACEESQRITIEMRKLGIECYSCDIIEPSGEHPEWHILGDVIPYINGNCSFKTMDGTEHTIKGEWDLIIAHPPCTYLTVSGNRWYNIEQYGDKARARLAAREDAIHFFMSFINAQCAHIAVENPIGIMSSQYRKPDQIIQPFEYGDPERKSTCLWLKGLPKLKPTNIVEPQLIRGGDGKLYSKSHWDSFYLPKKDRAKARSKTFPGIAQAIANQWGKYLLDNN